MALTKTMVWSNPFLSPDQQPTVHTLILHALQQISVINFLTIFCGNVQKRILCNLATAPLFWSHSTSPHTLKPPAFRLTKMSKFQRSKCLSVKFSLSPTTCRGVYPYLLIAPLGHGKYQGFFLKFNVKNFGKQKHFLFYLCRKYIFLAQNCANMQDFTFISCQFQLLKRFYICDLGE